MIGKTISHYRIVRKLGSGGMGDVYEAIDDRLDRRVALKFLQFESSTDPEARARFIREARSASALDHPNICTVYEVDETPEGLLFIAMAYYGGQSLAERLTAGSMGLGETLEIAIHASEGLARAHAMGIFHRDIKPGNLMVTDEGMVKIVDFGLAKLSGGSRITRTGTTVGTPGYMSPEQVSGANVDQRTDVWALGVMLYEMLTGVLPFVGDNQASTIYAILEKDPIPASQLRGGLPVRLEHVIGKALQKDPTARYQSVTELLIELKAIRSELSAETDILVTIATTRRPVRTRSLLALLVIVIALAVLLTVAKQPRERSTETAAEGDISPAASKIDSIAVLPLKNLSGDPNEDYFADGFTEALIASIARIGSLRVVSRTSVMTFKDSKLPLPEIARALGVKAVIEGSVQRSGDRVRVTAQLIDASTDEHLWVDTLDRDMSDVLSLQSEIARSVATRIEAAIGPSNDSKSTIDPKAYEAYLRAREANQRMESTRAVEYYRLAIELEPDFALAHAGLASQYVFEAVNGRLRPRDVFPLAATAARKALEIDPGLSEAHAANGKVQLYFDLDWQGADESLRKAISLNPSSVEAHQSYGFYLASTRRFEEAIEEMKIARDLDPLSPLASWTVPWAYFLAERFPESIAGFVEIRERFPNLLMTHTFLALNYAAMGLEDEAISECGVSLSVMTDATTQGLCGWVYGKVGREKKAREILERLLVMSKAQIVDPFNIATIYAAIGEDDLAMDWFEKTYHDRFPSVLNINAGPHGAIREHPRFKALIDRIGFPKE